jgi:hypothetical protein
LAARARAGDRDAAEQVATAIARDARSKRELAARRTSVGVGAGAVIAFALVFMRSGLNSSAFGIGLLVGVAIGIIIGVPLGVRQRGQSSKSDA